MSSCGALHNSQTNVTRYIYGTWPVASGVQLDPRRVKQLGHPEPDRRLPEGSSPQIAYRSPSVGFEEHIVHREDHY